MAFVVQFAESVERVAKLPVEGAKDGPVTVAWPALGTAVNEALSRGETHYTDRPGILPLREQVTKSFSKRFGLEADARSAAVITCGVVEARFVALQQILKAGEGLWVPEALVPRYAGAAVLRRANLATSSKGAKLVCLASSLGEYVLRKALSTAPGDAVLLFEVDDETGASFHPAQLEEFADRTVTIGPIGYASWQMGYLLAPSKMAAGLRDFKQALTICSTNLSQWAALAEMEAQ